MSAERFLKAILVATALMVAVPAAAQTVSSADLHVADAHPDCPVQFDHWHEGSILSLGARDDPRPTAGQDLGT